VRLIFDVRQIWRMDDAGERWGWQNKGQWFIKPLGRWDSPIWGLKGPKANKNKLGFRLQNPIMIVCGYIYIYIDNSIVTIWGEGLNYRYLDKNTLRCWLNYKIIDNCDWVFQWNCLWLIMLIKVRFASFWTPLLTK